MNLKPKHIILAAIAGAAMAVLFLYFVVIPKMQKKCHKDGFEAGVKFMNKLHEEIEKTLVEEGKSKLEKAAALERYNLIFKAFEKKYKVYSSQKKIIEKSDDTEWEKKRKISEMEAQFEEWLKETGLI